MKELFIKDINTGQYLDNGIFLIKNFKVKKTQSNKEFWDLTLSDKTGEINAKVWQDNIESCIGCQEGKVVLVSGQVDEFKNQKQIIIEKLEAIEDFDAADFIEKTSKDTDQLFKIAEKNISKVKNKFLKQLLEKFYKDKDFIGKIKQAPGAEKIHHAYLGGLLEHKTEMLEYAKPVIENYPNIDQDLLITGILLHDIGKMDELEINTVIKRTIKGKMIGHLAISFQKVSKAMDEIKDFPQDLANKVSNLILSHHGRLEYGSPVKPVLLESVVLYYLDELSAKTNVAAKLYELGKNSAEIFSQRHFALDNTEIYLGQDEDNSQPKLI